MNQNRRSRSAGINGHVGPEYALGTLFYRFISENFIDYITVAVTPA